MENVKFKAKLYHQPVNADDAIKGKPSLQHATVLVYMKTTYTHGMYKGILGVNIIQA